MQEVLVMVSQIKNFVDAQEKGTFTTVQRTRFVDRLTKSA